MALPRNFASLLFSLFLAGLAQCLILQKDQPWTLGPAVLLYAAAIFLFLFRSGTQPNPSHPMEKLPLKTEITLLVLIGFFALFFRLYRLLSIPPGITVEEACGPWVGFSVPPKDWIHFFLAFPLQTFPDIVGLSFFWFRLFTPSHLSFSLFYVFISLMAFPLGYWLFRTLSGARAALLALFFWSIMQWQVSLGRSGHAGAACLFYILGTVLFSDLGRRKNKKIFWMLAGLCFGAGFYAYPAFRACAVLMVVLFLYDHFQAPHRWRQSLAGIGVFALTALVVAFPILSFMWRQHWLVGAYCDQNFIGNQIASAKSLRPLWHNLSQTALTFLRTGDLSAQAGLPGHRLLDDATAPLCLLGFFLALGRFRERRYFYGLAGLTALSLTALLSEDASHSSRMLGAAPFIAYLAALAAMEFWERASGSKSARKLLAVLAVLAALLATGENFKVYFIDRPRDLSCWEQAGMEATAAGQAIADEGDGNEYYLSPVYFGNYTVQFLGYSQMEHTHPLNLPEVFKYLSPPAGRGLCFVLQEGRTGLLKTLQTLYPGGTTEVKLDPRGQPYLYFFRVSARDALKNQGLQPAFPNPKVENDYSQFPSGLPQKPFTARLTGSLWIEKTGIYRYRLAGNVKITKAPGCPWLSTRPLYLTRGFHPLDFVLSSTEKQNHLEIAESLGKGPFQPLDSARLIPHRFPHGWRADYRLSGSWNAPPVLTQSDLVLNFSNHNDFPLKTYPPLRVEWRGTLLIENPGHYQFLMLATDHSQAQFTINGKEVGAANHDLDLFLGKGQWPVKIRLWQDEGVNSAFHLLWKPPGEKTYKVLPPEALN
jgi:hypothetical protein